MNPLALTFICLAVLAFLILVPVIAASNKRNEEHQAQVEANRRADEARREEERRANDPAEIARRQQAAAESEATRQELAKRGKKPIPSSWDGITPEANRYLKANLKDYDSLKLVECSVVVAWGDDAWAQRVKYRAKNSFGGYVLSEQLFIIRDGQVINVIGE